MNLNLCDKIRLRSLYSSYDSCNLLLSHYFQVMKADKQSTESPDRLRGSARIYRSSIKIDVPNIVSMSAYVDLTLPGSAGLCVHTIHHPIYLVKILRPKQEDQK